MTSPSLGHVAEALPMFIVQSDRTSVVRAFPFSYSSYGEIARISNLGRE